MPGSDVSLSLIRMVWGDCSLGTEKLSRRPDGAGTILAFRRHLSNSSTCRIKLRGFPPDAAYAVPFADNGLKISAAQKLRVE